MCKACAGPLLRAELLLNHSWLSCTADSFFNNLLQDARPKSCLWLDLCEQGTAEYFEECLGLGGLCRKSLPHISNISFVLVAEASQERDVSVSPQKELQKKTDLYHLQKVRPA